MSACWLLRSELMRAQVRVHNFSSSYSRRRDLKRALLYESQATRSWTRSVVDAHAGADLRVQASDVVREEMSPSFEHTVRREPCLSPPVPIRFGRSRHCFWRVTDRARRSSSRSYSPKSASTTLAIRWYLKTVRREPSLSPPVPIWFGRSRHCLWRVTDRAQRSSSRASSP